MSHKTSEISQSLKTLHRSAPVNETIYRYIHIHVPEVSCKCTHRFPSSIAMGRIVHFGRGFPVWWVSYVFENVIVPFYVLIFYV